MLDNEFCSFLEHEISKAFANSNNDRVKHFWCDGVLLPTFENEYSKKFVNDKFYYFISWNFYFDCSA